MELAIPELSLVVLIGASGSGKSTFARTHFLPTETISSDFCRGLVADDENDQSATDDAFAVLHYIAGRRLAAKRLTVVDATNVQAAGRKALLDVARAHHVLPVAIVFDLPERVCHARNAARPDRQFGPHVVARQTRELRRSLTMLRREGFRHIWRLSSEDDVANAKVVRAPLLTNKNNEHGPFDLIGDVHGCAAELRQLLATLGYAAQDQEQEKEGTPVYRHPEGRRAVYLGDLVDRGPATPEVLRIVMAMVRAGTAFCVMGNHENKLLRKLNGRDVQLTHGIAETMAQLAAEPPAFSAHVRDFLDGLVSHYTFDGGKLVAAHAGLKEEFQGRASGAVRSFALYGDTTGESDEYGLPVRQNWAADYRGRAIVVYGHVPTPEPEWLNGTTCIDTGVVFGGKLTALRYPEREFVSVPAAQQYYEPARPFLPSDTRTELSAQQVQDELLDIDDVLGKRLLTTRLHGTLTIPEERAATALEVMSRFAVSPKWLVYLPPTMAPTATSRREDALEYPDEAFAYFQENGVEVVICEEKHMGSRAVVVVCRDADAARRRFGITSGESGVCYTRTGRRFFDDLETERLLLERVRAAVDAADLWGELETDWLLLDCELMPWSAKARGLLVSQYAPTGTAATHAFAAALTAAGEAAAAGVDLGPLRERLSSRAGLAGRYVQAYQRYCWAVDGIAGVKLAPFHLLAAEGRVFTANDHRWHMDTLARLAAADASGLLMATPYRLVATADEHSRAEGAAWWEELTARGGEGMVVKPLEFVTRGPRGLVQPAVKVRGREYLRIIYGPEYTEPANLDRLRRRGLGLKRSLALREFALGVEALERFTQGEPLRRVHECVFGVLALESEPVDPRL